jgi:uncharacterized protein DUF4279
MTLDETLRSKLLCSNSGGVDELEHHEYTASLRVFSMRLTFAELEDRFGAASGGYDIGDPKSRRRPDGPRWPHALWRLESSLERSRPLDEHIEELMKFAELRRDALDSVRADGDIDISCGIFSADDAQGGFTFDSPLIQRLADLQLAVVFDVY